MPDQTPVTDDDRLAHEWAHANKGRANDSVARAIFRHVPAPPESIADELREWGCRRLAPDEVDWKAFGALADRVEAVVQERDACHGEVERLQDVQADNSGTIAHLTRERDEARSDSDQWKAQYREEQKVNVKVIAELDKLKFDTLEGKTAIGWMEDAKSARVEVERLTASLNRHCTTATPSVHNTDVLTVSSDALPDPADVPGGEVWEVLIDGHERTVGFRGHGTTWTCYRESWAEPTTNARKRITLVSRLVPDTRRVIDRPEDLDALPVGSVVLDQHGEPWKHRQMDWEGRNYRRDSENLIEVEGPVTVLWEPGVTA